MNNATKTWIKKFVKLHKTAIEKKMKVCQAMNTEIQKDSTQVMTVMAINKKMLYYKAQLDLLKVLIFTTI